VQVNSAPIANLRPDDGAYAGQKIAFAVVIAFGHHAPCTLISTASSGRAAFTSAELVAEAL